MSSRSNSNSDNCTMGDYWSGATVYLFPEEWNERTGSSRCCNEMRDPRGNNGSMMIVEDDEDRHDNNTGDGGGWDITVAVDVDLYKANTNNNNKKNEQRSSLWLSCFSCV